MSMKTSDQNSSRSVSFDLMYKPLNDFETMNKRPVDILQEFNECMVRLVRGNKCVSEGTNPRNIYGRGVPTTNENIGRNKYV